LFVKIEEGSIQANQQYHILITVKTILVMESKASVMSLIMAW
tara:strand:- start:1752 stop:1877 length:126 start_codon:yes stop_codon:yes gene_type:complete